MNVFTNLKDSGQFHDFFHAAFYATAVVCVAVIYTVVRILTKSDQERAWSRAEVIFIVIVVILIVFITFSHYIQ